jgi:PPK2 family polyphosphate:nucleotide phosphotransferase
MPVKPILLKPQAACKLADYDPAGILNGLEKDAALIELEGLKVEIATQQRMLMAGRQQRLLVILQGMDGSGKDGTVRHVFGGLDPHGVRVVPFKSPTVAERDRDFLWRVHPHVPTPGEIVVFNRSHYEDIVAVGVKNLAPRDVWERRYEHINNFERLLMDEGTMILKFFLHISRDEQRRRLESRIADPMKRWKIFPEDLADRKLWPSFTEAYERVLSRTGTEQAPWHVIPADRKWLRNLTVATVLRETLAGLKLKYPAPTWDVSQAAIS